MLIFCGLRQIFFSLLYFRCLVATSTYIIWVNLDAIKGTAVTSLQNKIKCEVTLFKISLLHYGINYRRPCFTCIDLYSEIISLDKK